MCRYIQKQWPNFNLSDEILANISEWAIMSKSGTYISTTKQVSRGRDTSIQSPKMISEPISESAS